MISSIHRIVEDEGDLLVVFIHSCLNGNRKSGFRNINAGCGKSIAAELEAVDTTRAGTYVVSGMCEGLLTSITLTVRPSTLISDDVAGFETSDYEVEYDVTGEGITVHDTHDARSGSYSAHWWSAEGSEGSVTLTAPYELTEAGTYVFTGCVQGDGDKGSYVTFKIVDAATGDVLAASDQVQTTGWNTWLMPEATLTVTEPVTVNLVIDINYAPDGWGSVDDLLFYMAESGEAAVDTDTDTDADTEQAPVTEAPVSAAVPSSGSSSGQPSSNVNAHDLSSFIDMLYRRLLGREPDESGKQYWLSSVRSGDMTVGELIEGFIGSEEYQALNKTNEEYIEDLYFVCLRRESDESGLSNWLNVLASVDDRTAIISGFINSEEYSKLPKD